MFDDYSMWMQKLHHSLDGWRPPSFVLVTFSRVGKKFAGAFMARAECVTVSTKKRRHTDGDDGQSMRVRQLVSLSLSSLLCSWVIEKCNACFDSSNGRGFKKSTKKANKNGALLTTKRKQHLLLIRLDDRRARVGIIKVSVQEILCFLQFLIISIAWIYC